MTELIIILIIVACIAWIVWILWESEQVLKEAVLDDAWREVLDDPHYMERRHLEERKRVVDKARAATANR